MFLDGSSGGKVEDGDFVVWTAVEGVNVLHKEMGLVEGREVVSKEFLGPSTEDVNQPIIFEDSIQGVHVAEGKKKQPQRYRLYTPTAQQNTAISPI